MGVFCKGQNSLIPLVLQDFPCPAPTVQGGLRSPFFSNPLWGPAGPCRPARAMLITRFGFDCFKKRLTHHFLLTHASASTSVVRLTGRSLDLKPCKISYGYSSTTVTFFHSIAIKKTPSVLRSFLKIVRDTVKRPYDRYSLISKANLVASSLMLGPMVLVI
jgi:hypothetical protein